MNLPIFLLILLFAWMPSVSDAQTVDLLIRNGHVIDPRNNIDGVMDIAVHENKVFQTGRNLRLQARKTIDATGLYVTPGLIDLHGHHFWGTQPHSYLANSFTALPPDGFTFRAGVTTAVDAGGPGWRNFNTYRENVIEKSRTRILAFLNIVGAGMSGGVNEQNTADMDPKLAAMTARANKQYIVGFKLAHYSGHEWLPTERVVEAGNLAELPVMIDFGGANPPLPLRTLLMDKLRPGDIYTHCYAGVAGRGTLVVDSRLQPWALEAQKRGIIFDVGHGGGSFLFEQAIPAIKQGLKPNTISTDLHTGSMNGAMKDMLNVVSKLLNCGLILPEVIRASTWTPAQVIHRDELGHLSPGAPADIAIFSLQKGQFGFVDVSGKKIIGDRKLTCELTLRDGRIVYDLNGLAAEEYR